MLKIVLPILSGKKRQRQCDKPFLCRPSVWPTPNVLLGYHNTLEIIYDLLITLSKIVVEGCKGH